MEEADVIGRGEFAPSFGCTMGSPIRRRRRRRRGEQRCQGREGGGEGAAVVATAIHTYL